MPDKQRIAILGGGIAGLTTAYELTEQDGWDQRFEITVYQLGWRLGGKGASGRNVSGDPGLQNRIEEHGLHVWFGFYENAFNLMQRSYKALGRRAGTPMATWQDAFHPQAFAGSQEFYNNIWEPWLIDTPTERDAPGQGKEFPSPRDYLERLLHYADEMFTRIKASEPDRGAQNKVEAGARGVVRGARTVAATGAVELIQQVHEKVAELKTNWAGREGIFKVLDGLLDRLLTELNRTAGKLLSKAETRRAYIGVELALTTMRGLVVDKPFDKGFDSIEHLDLRDWLHNHGASPFTLQSAFMNSAYDSVFGFVGGDPNKEALSAGTGIRSGLRMFFGYKGAFMWLMRAGMGDIVMTPLYEVLRRRGVKFAFFHRVDALHPAAAENVVDSIDLTRQVDLNVAEYNPLIDVAGLGCWPSEPRYEQLVQGEELQRRTRAGENVNLESYWSSWQHGTRVQLRRGQDFDKVVLAIPNACHEFLCPELLARSEEWALMARSIQSMRTMAAQVWLSPRLAELGWPHKAPFVTGFVRPLSTYADMTHLIPQEQFAGSAPGHLAYFCGPMRDTHQPPFFTDPDYPARETAIVVEETRKLLGEHMKQWMWKEFSWDALHDGAGRSGEARLAAQYFRANIDPNERYVLSVKGTAQYRLGPDQSGFTNLIFAGDWTRNGLNAGCIEAAVMSGMQAARAIDKHERKIVGEHDVVPVS